MAERVKKALTIILILSFILFLGTILVPSWMLLADGAADTPPIPRPQVPQLPAEIDDSTIAQYSELVAAYEKSVVAYTALATAAKPPKPERVYELVVKNTITDLFAKILAAFLSYVFVKAGATIVDNVIRMRNKEPPMPITLL